MKMQRLSDGTEMPALGLGTWKSEPEQVYRAVRYALEVGYRHIDCAAIYENEEHVGRALQDGFTAGDANREDVWVTSKLWNDAHLRRDVRPAAETSLRKLKLDYLDLYLVHWPVALVPGVQLPRGAQDFLTLEDAPLEATWEAMLGLRDSGIARQTGVSNFSKGQILRVRDATGHAPAVNQIELHPYLQQQRLVDACTDLGVAVTAYAPLGSPDSAALFGRDDDVLLTLHPAVVGIAEARGATPGQVLLAWAVARGTSVIPKSANPKRIAENLGALDVTLTETDMAALAELDRHRRMIDGSFWFLGDVYSPETVWDEASL